mmetsp:Transcript_1672/g.2961  ORF Transcript_1672/g.2961 Transcript_1672/m.2961 type:complete len:81 (-) Transcript_1672:633-875(-)|eukprot:CAMPEP_0168608994 /NCGR_PEP_ID=MMETSP0449_2-20121227/954_1 /TAXON_ID=1082188 /ORGANISM="Strombidium rassoulzadegani, Strain ras09" /LENGTH=80 /DNA_ID=CAMNT_0008649077 /DNA_START=1182 /DNA_END=1424 /DNA_ORIENTATION=-
MEISGDPEEVGRDVRGEKKQGRQGAIAHSQDSQSNNKVPPMISILKQLILKTQKKSKKEDLMSLYNQHQVSAFRPAHFPS